MNAAMIAYSRSHLLRIIGLCVLLALLYSGLFVGGPILWHATATPVTVQELSAAPNTYLNQFVEMRGTLMHTGLEECTAMGFELFELDPPHRRFSVLPHVNRDQLPLGPFRVWGTIREAHSYCGPGGPLYLDIMDVELLPAAPAP